MYSRCVTAKQHKHVLIERFDPFRHRCTYYRVSIVCATRVCWKRIQTRTRFREWATIVLEYNMFWKSCAEGFDNITKTLTMYMALNFTFLLARNNVTNHEIVQLNSKLRRRCTAINRSNGRHNRTLQLNVLHI